MMNVKKFVVVLAAIAVLLAAGCGSTPEGTTTIRASADMFREGGNGTLTINNRAKFDVIIFAGAVSNNNVLGGIRAGSSRTFDISTLNLPSRNGSFLIRAASFETYSSPSRGYRITENDVLYTGLVVYDLNDSRDRTDLNIFAGISSSQREYIYVSNRSRFVLELRIELNGEKIATLAPLQENKKIFLNPPEDGLWYNFYATYVYINPDTNEITSFSAKDRSERQRDTPRADGVTPLVFEGPGSNQNIGFQVGFINIKNDTLQAVSFNDGRTILADQKGQRLIRSGDLSTFELPSLSGGDSGQLYTNLILELDRGEIRVSNLTIVPGVVYECVISEQNGNIGYDVREIGRKNIVEDMRISLFLGG